MGGGDEPGNGLYYRYRHIGIRFLHGRLTVTSEVAIVTDSVACIPRELVEKYDIVVVPIQVIFSDRAYRDGIDITPSQFYALLRQAKRLPTTAASLPGPVFEAYQRASRKASNLLCITLSVKFSGMFNSAMMAAEMAKETLQDVIFLH